MDKFCSEDLDKVLGRKALITGLSFPAASQGYHFWSHKVAKDISYCIYYITFCL